MAEERLRRAFADAFEPGPGFPDPRLLGRTMAALTETGSPPPARRRFFIPSVPGRQLIAAALIVLLMFAAVGAFLALRHFGAAPSSVWSGCGGSFQCSTIKVPLDYANPSGESIDIAVVRKPATDQAHRVGSLLLAGPPAGVDFLRMNSAFYSDQFRKFDLVAFDERGFGRSSPIRCLTDAQIDAVDQVDTVLDDPQEQQVFTQANQAVAQACEQKAGRLLPFVDSESDARDLDAIRAAIGESKITFLGFGNATLLGQEYARLFPSRVRAMALDGLVDPAASLIDEWRLRATGYEAELQAFLTSCRTSASCALGQSTDPGTALARLMNSIDQNRLRVGSRVLGRRLAIAGLMYGLDPQAWSMLDSALGDAIRGDGAALLALADAFDGRTTGGGYLQHPEALTAQLCVDRSVSTQLDDFPVRTASAIFGPAFQYLPLVCESWPVRPRSAPAPLTSPGAPPVLLVGGTHDPYYPFAETQAVHAELAGSVLLTRDGYGVFSYVNSGCARTAINAYLTKLTLTAPGTTCPSDYPA